MCYTINERRRNAGTVQDASESRATEEEKDMQATFDREQEKIFIRFMRDEWGALAQEKKEKVKRAFLWSPRRQAWASRAKEPNLYAARLVCEELGAPVEKVGERLTMAEKVEREKERAEERAARYDRNADAAEERADKLARPLEEKRGDIAFFTQPNINSTAGRAFKRYRENVYKSYEKSIDEYRKSEYYKGKAEAARDTAAGSKYNDAAYVERKADESRLTLKHLAAHMESYERIYNTLTSGETAKTLTGELWTVEEVAERMDDTAERMDAERDRLAFFLNRFEELGGNRYGRENIKKGYLVKIKTGRFVRVIGTGPKNFTANMNGFPIKCQYACIESIESTEEEKPAAHPFTVGESWQIGGRTWTITKTTAAGVTLESDTGKTLQRKPARSVFRPNEWKIYIDKNSLDGYVTKSAQEIVKK